MTATTTRKDDDMGTGRCWLLIVPTFSAILPASIGGCGGIVFMIYPYNTLPSSCIPSYDLTEIVTVPISADHMLVTRATHIQTGLWCPS